MSENITVVRLSTAILTRKCPSCKKNFQTYDPEKICCGTLCRVKYIHNNKRQSGRPKMPKISRSSSQGYKQWLKGVEWVVFGSFCSLFSAQQSKGEN
jgi:hypothetical protein